MLTATQSTRRLALIVAITGLALIALPATASAAPRSFFGLQAWSLPSGKEFKTIGKAGAGTFRGQVGWDAVEPTPGQRDWSKPDALFARAARARMTVLPYLLGSPAFAASRPQYPPMSASARQAFLRFVRDFTARYGNNGTFWTSNPGLPKRPPKVVQVWNEPNFRGYWNGSPNAGEYKTLVAQTRSAVHAVDPRIKIALAGFPQTRLGIAGTTFFRQFYAAGGKSTFDIAAVHPYAREARGVVSAVRSTRKIMRGYGDSSKPAWITEVGWATGGQGRGSNQKFRTSRRGQAKLLKNTFRAALKYRRRYKIGLVAWFSFKDRRPMPGESNWWAIHTGLLTRSGRPKPAWRTFKRIAP